MKMEYPTGEKATDDEQIDDRDRRALEQYLTVLEAPNGRSGEYEVVSESGSSYVVNTLLGTCDCPDHEYRNVKCKHRRRVEFATGHRDVPDDADIDVDPQLGMHVESVDDAKADGGRAVATDGGEVEDSETLADEIRAADVEDVEAVLDKHDPMVETVTDDDRLETDGGVTVREAAEGTEVTHTDDKYAGPFPEHDRYGNPTGVYYETCNGCSREFLEDVPESARAHRDSCRFDDSSDDGRDKPQRHEPADFGGGESTGVQDL